MSASSFRRNIIQLGLLILLIGLSYLYVQEMRPHQSPAPDSSPTAAEQNAPQVDDTPQAEPPFSLDADAGRIPSPLYHSPAATEPVQVTEAQPPAQASEEAPIPADDSAGQTAAKDSYPAEAWPGAPGTPPYPVMPPVTYPQPWPFYPPAYAGRGYPAPYAGPYPGPYRHYPPAPMGYPGYPPYYGY